MEIDWYMVVLITIFSILLYFLGIGSAMTFLLGWSFGIIVIEFHKPKKEKNV